MNATSSDTELLRAFVHAGDQEAFRAIVERHIQSVYGAARRQIRDAQLAEDVAQATFVMLARKADSIRDGAILGGWLVTTARLAAKTALRGEMRRHRREQRAATMSLQQDQQPSGGSGKPSDANDPSVAVEQQDTLERVDAAIDDALARLSPADRAAVTLRYLESRPIREVAQIMGTTEHAAAKRVTRAVARLRENFRRRRTDLAPAAFIAMLERQALVHVPAELSKQALAAATGASSGHAAIAIANDALARASLRAAVMAATGALLVILSVIAAIVYVSRENQPTVVRVSPAAAAMAMTITPSSSPPTSQPVVRVGVYLSHATAVHLTPSGKPRGWVDQMKILDELTPFGGEMEIRPLIEPGTETEPQTAQRLKQHFPGKRPIDVTDAAAMRREIDVILCCAICEPPQPAIDAIERAVRAGDGLVVRQCFGGHSDGLGGYRHPQIRLLRGMVEADPDMVSGRGQVAAEVTATHPLLGALSGRSGAKVPMTIYGGYGTLLPGSSTLLALREGAPLRHLTTTRPVEPHDGWSFVPLSTAQLDAGRIVSCNFAIARLPQELDQATNGKFTLNALKWAAGRRIE